MMDKTTSIHNNHKSQGFFSDIGMISGHYVNFHLPENLVVVGDIHGDFFTLEKIMDRIDFLSYLKNELNLLIFLGDYMDRGKVFFEKFCFFFAI